MRARGYLVGMVCLAFLAACDASSKGATGGEATKHRAVGRYQFAGKREYTNGTEVYYLDTMKGRVCYGFITNDDKPDTNRCTDSQAVIDGDG